MAIRLDKVEDSFLNTCKKYNLIESGDKIVVGVSGGPDSISLLHLLIKYKEKWGYTLVAAHVNHLIREDSTDDEQFVENYCSKNGIEFYAKRFDVEKFAQENKLSVEDAGRKIRYDFFEEIKTTTNANKIAIAHNKNDNAETFLLNLIRGAGLKGLEGIRAFEPKRNIIRPLIDVEKKDIIDFCEKEKLDPRIDSTNSQNIYRRNLIRNKILPELSEINPNIVQTLARTADIIYEENKFIEEVGEVLYSKVANIETNKISFELEYFNGMADVYKSYSVLKSIEILTGSRKNVGKVNVDDVIKIAANGVGGKFIQINKKIKATINKGHLEFYLC